MKKHTIALILIFLLALGFRLYFTFQTESLDHEAYFTVRQIQSITQTGTPIYQDPLSFGGRTLLFTPIFHYFLAIFNFSFASRLLSRSIRILRRELSNVWMPMSSWLTLFEDNVRILSSERL